MAVDAKIPTIDQDKARTFLDAYQAVVVKSWSDADFKAQLLADPTAVLRDAGVDIPEGMDIKLVEHQEGEKEGHTVVTLPLPAAPVAHLSDDELLAQVNAGSSCSSSAGSGSSASCPSCSASSAGSGGSAC